MSATNQTKELGWLSYLSNILPPTGQKVGGPKKIFARSARSQNCPPLSKPWRRPCQRCVPGLHPHTPILQSRAVGSPVIGHWGWGTRSSSYKAEIVETNRLRYTLQSPCRFGILYYSLFRQTGQTVWRTCDWQLDWRARFRLIDIYN